MSFCHKCGEALVMGWAYCQGCGAATGADATSPTDVAAQPLVSTAAGAPVPAADMTLTGGDDAWHPEWMDQASSEDTSLHSTLVTATLTHEGTAVDGAATSTIVASVTAATDHGPPAAGSSRRRKLLIRGGASLALVALVVTALNIVGTHDRLAKTRTRLASTEAELRDTRGTLADTEDELAVTEDDLETRTGERDQLRSQLSSTQGELTTANSNLTDARGKVDLQASVIEDLRYCLAGVAEAMVDLADGYWTGAISALDRVESACDRASNSVV